MPVSSFRQNIYMQNHQLCIANIHQVNSPNLFIKLNLRFETLISFFSSYVPATYVLRRKYLQVCFNSNGQVCFNSNGLLIASLREIIIALVQPFNALTNSQEFV